MPNAASTPAIGDTAYRIDADRGPRYTETPRDPSSPDAPVPAEPWNTVTAAFFIVLVAVWLVRLRGRFRQFPFVAACLPILAVGAIGGTLYHATRTRFVYFLLDLVPIMLLGLAAAIYLAVRLGRAYGVKRVLFIATGIVGMYFFTNFYLFRFIRSDYPTTTVNLSYAMMAVMILIPILITLIRTKFRHAWLVWAGLASFGIAWVCRLIDPSSPLPMGTHWLWHTFGCVAVAFLFEYFYRLEGENPEAKFQPFPSRVEGVPDQTFTE